MRRRILAASRGEAYADAKFVSDFYLLDEYRHRLPKQVECWPWQTRPMLFGRLHGYCALDITRRFSDSVVNACRIARDIARGAGLAWRAVATTELATRTYPPTSWWPTAMAVHLDIATLVLTLYDEAMEAEKANTNPKVREALDYIRAHPGEKQDTVARAIHRSPSHFRSRIVPKLIPLGVTTKSGMRLPPQQTS